MLTVLNAFCEFCSDHLGLYTIQNYIEVSILTGCMYKILRWLQQDSTKHIILYVYAYAALMIASYLFSCITLFWIMFLSLPLAALICIMAHQKQIQKNFILASSKDLTPHTLPVKNWLDLLIRAHLLASYQNKQIFCVLQRTDHLASMLQSDCNLFVPIQQSIIDLIFSSNALGTPSFLWITDSGTINSVNASWKETVLAELLHPYNLNHAAITLLTGKTDAIVWTIDVQTKMATLWHQGKAMQQITIDQLLGSCKQILNKRLSIEKSGVSYAVKNTSSHFASKFD
jgi:hypothetical protein